MRLIHLTTAVCSGFATLPVYAQSGSKADGINTSSTNQSESATIEHHYHYQQQQQQQHATSFLHNETGPPVERASHQGSDPTNAAKGYVDTCIDCMLFSKWSNGRPLVDSAGSKMRCECDYPGRPAEVRRRMSFVDLNTKIGNAAGHLLWHSKNYRASCKQCALNKGRFLACECSGGEKEWQTAVIDLNAFIINEGGFLIMT